RTARAPPRRSRRRPPSGAWSRVNSAARCRWRYPRRARFRRSSSASDARNRSAADRARPASPSARRDRRALGAAPHAGGASQNDYDGFPLVVGDPPKDEINRRPLLYHFQRKHYERRGLLPVYEQLGPVQPAALRYLE